MLFINNKIKYLYIFIYYSKRNFKIMLVLIKYVKFINCSVKRDIINLSFEFKNYIFLELYIRYFNV